MRWRKQRRRATIPRLKTDRRCAEDWAVGAIAQNSPYAGEGMRVQPIPLISYEREHFFFRGITAGWQFVGDEAFELDSIVQARFDGFDINELTGAGWP